MGGFEDRVTGLGRRGNDLTGQTGRWRYSHPIIHNPGPGFPTGFLISGRSGLQKGGFFPLLPLRWGLKGMDSNPKIGPEFDWLEPLAPPGGPTRFFAILLAAAQVGRIINHLDHSFRSLYQQCGGRGSVANGHYRLSQQPPFEHRQRGK